ncbi:phage tail terminator protein, partial [Salmonella enterica]|uniref:phage tail terminator protein n=1 Tax=Salmonella enterica TaxID=28901 RepID=UPI00265A38B6
MRAQAPDTALDIWMEEKIFPALEEVSGLERLIDTMTPLGYDYQRDSEYLDDENADWKSTTQGQKSVGDTTATLAWKPGETGQKKLVELFDTGEVRAFRIRYPNGTVDVFRGWLSSLGKTVTSKEVMTRSVKITGVGRPSLAEEDTPDV